jgi:hypothetical protein
MPEHPFQQDFQGFMATSHAPEGWKKKVSPIIAPIHEFSATEIKALRECEEVSQTVFALHECEQRFSQPMGTRTQKTGRPKTQAPLSNKTEGAVSYCLTNPY